MLYACIWLLLVVANVPVLDEVSPKSQVYVQESGSDELFGSLLVSVMVATRLLVETVNDAVGV